MQSFKQRKLPCISKSTQVTMIRKVDVCKLKRRDSEESLSGSTGENKGRGGRHVWDFNSIFIISPGKNISFLFHHISLVIVRSQMEEVTCKGTNAQTHSQITESYISLEIYSKVFGHTCNILAYLKHTPLYSSSDAQDQ